MKVKFITTNENKFREAREILGDFIEHITMDVPEIQAERLEDVVDFEINYLMRVGMENFFVEDSGLFIYSLRGFPGVYSSYVYKTIGCEGILKLMNDISNRNAVFVCCIGGCINGIVFKVVGKCAGHISHEMRGRGFGFDPIFVPEGEKKTFGEMNISEKNLYSHRGVALRKLRDLLQILRTDS